MRSQGSDFHVCVTTQISQEAVQMFEKFCETKKCEELGKEVLLNPSPTFHLGVAKNKKHLSVTLTQFEKAPLRLC